MMVGTSGGIIGAVDVVAAVVDVFGAGSMTRCWTLMAATFIVGGVDEAHGALCGTVEASEAWKALG